MKLKLGRRVRTWPGETEDEHAGYVTACRKKCAHEAAETAGLLLMPDVEDHAEREDEMGECDACGFPNPASMSRETVASLTPEERRFIEQGGGSLDRADV